MLRSRVSAAHQQAFWTQFWTQTAANGTERADTECHGEDRKVSENPNVSAHNQTGLHDLARLSRPLGHPSLRQD
jgi:hypothetical protein